MRKDFSVSKICNRTWHRDESSTRTTSAGTYKLTAYMTGDSGVRVVDTKTGDVLVSQERTAAIDHTVVIAFQITYPAELAIEYALESKDALVNTVQLFGTSIS